MKKRKFEVIAPAIWSDIASYDENMYDEIVNIKKGVGYCDYPSSADRLRKLGYTVNEL